MKDKYNKLRDILIKRISGNDFGFIDLNKLPEGNYTADNLDIYGINWVKTSDLKYGKNHCGATVASNIILYLSNKSHLNFYERGQEYDIFSEAHSIIGNGPVLFLGNKIEKFFNKKGYNINSKRIKSFQDIKKSIEVGRPCALLLFTSLKNWHWVVAIGWREYESGEKYLQIVDSWKEDSNRFYRIGKASILISAREYSLNL